jgi:hypothetical protein
MSIANSFRKGLKFLLMSLGVSSPEKKPPRPAGQVQPKKNGK